MAEDYGVTEVEETVISLLGDHPPVEIPVTLASDGATDQALKRGTVLGKITLGAGTPAEGAGNTGDAVIPDDGVTVLAAAQVGVYNLVCITADGGGPASDAVFAVYAPDGSRLPNATQGVEYAGGHLTFTIGDASSTGFAVDDTLTITVAAGSGKYEGLDPDGTDGSQTAAAILARDITVADDSDAKATAYVHGEFREDDLVWTHTGITNNEKAAAVADLFAAGIFCK